MFATRDEITSKEAFDLDMRFLDRSHDAGFDGVAINHHYASGPLAQTFQPIPLAGHIMAKYPDLYVMTAVFILPYHNPIEIAEQLVSLHREFDVESFIFQQYTPGMDSGAALEMIDRVGREVVPLVRSEVDERPSLFAR